MKVYIHGVPQPIRPILGYDRGQKTKPKIIFPKFFPSLFLGRIRFQRFALVTNQEREFALRYTLYLSARDEYVLRANPRS